MSDDTIQAIAQDIVRYKRWLRMRGLSTATKVRATGPNAAVLIERRNALENRVRAVGGDIDEILKADVDAAWKVGLYFGENDNWFEIMQAMQQEVQGDNNG